MNGFAQRFLRDDRGAFSIMTAALAAVIVAFAGLAVDSASLFYWQQRLQTAADAAAMAATFDLPNGATVAAMRFQALGFPAGDITQGVTGVYTDDPATAAASRFQAGAPSPNAYRLTAVHQAPIYLMRIFSGNATVAVGASATAYQLPLGGIAVTNGLLGGSIGQFNTILQDVSGSTAQLSQAESDALNRTAIPLFRLFDGLAATQGSSTRSIAQVSAGNANLSALAQSAANALTAEGGTQSSDTQTSISALTRLSQQGGGSTAVPVSDILTMAAHTQRAAQDLVSTATDALSVPGLPVIDAYQQAAGDGQLIDLSQSLGSIASIKIALARPSVLGGTDRGAIAIGPDGTAASTAAGVIAVTVSLPSLPVVGSLSIPIILELYPSSATITDVSCGTDLMTSTNVSVSVQGGLVHAYIGTLNNLSDLGAALPQVSLLGGLIKIGSNGTSDIGSSTPQTLTFNRSDISAGTIKTVGTGATVAAALSSLSNLNIISSVPLAPPALIQTTLQAVLNTLAPTLDSLLTSLGLQIASTNVRAATVRCGIPALVN